MFHIHTELCKHAFGDPIEYIDLAIKLGAEKIWFTDHVPLPGDTFRGRMDMDELPVYVKVLKELRKQYEGRINIKIGLECEWLPKSFPGYLESLWETGDFDLLLLGQHFAETPSGLYTFETDNKTEADYLAESILQAMETGTILEHNLSSMEVSRKQRHYRPEFWEICPADVKTIYGLDGHSVEDTERRYLKKMEMLKAQREVQHEIK